MQYNDIRKNENKGFSLVELIVVIAIMAVMTAVLAPSLLSYVERSRAQKDDSAMGEVVNVIELALSDQNVFDEVYAYAHAGNYSCYIDQEEEGYDTGHPAQKIVNKVASGDKKAQYTFDSNARLKDETVFWAAGNMRGVTITFQPEMVGNSKTQYKIANGIVNKFINATQKGSVSATAKKAAGGERDDTVQVGGNCDHANGGTVGTMGVLTTATDYNKYYLYNRLRANIGTTVDLSSQTYRNSEYTVFIRMGTSGGNQADSQDAIEVYGQWNGTNLPYTAPGTSTT